MAHDAATARTEYENARAELQRIIDDLDSTEAEAAAASAALQALAMDFAAASMDNFDQRTELLNKIVANLKDVIESSDDNPSSVDLQAVVGNVQVIGLIADRVKTLLDSNGETA